MFDDAPLAKFLHHSITLLRDWTILDVQLLQATTIVGHALDPLVTDHFATFNAQLF